MKHLQEFNNYRKHTLPKEWQLEIEWTQTIIACLSQYGIEAKPGEFYLPLNYSFTKKYPGRAGKYEDVLLEVWMEVGMTAQPELGWVVQSAYSEDEPHDISSTNGVEGMEDLGIVMSALQAKYPEYFEAREMGFFNKETN